MIFMIIHKVKCYLFKFFLYKTFPLIFLFFTLFTLGCGGKIPVEWQDIPEKSGISENENPQYMRKDDGFFSLIEDGNGTPLKTQKGGTCWLNAASTSMESNYLRLHHKKITIDPMPMLDIILGEAEGKTEGYYVDEKANAVDIGGMSFMIANTLSNKYMDYVITEACDYSSASIDEMKTLIKKYGAMNVGIQDVSSRFQYTDGYYCMNDSSNAYDHSVVLVGWDDNFPKDYFRRPASRDGAWIVQNSFGKLWGNDGFYYVSYDTILKEQVVFNVSKEYKKVLSHDAGTHNSFQLGKETTTGNKFREKGKLKAVGTFTYGRNQTVKIQVYKDDFGKLLASTEATFEYPGYHVAVLPKKVSVEDFQIAVTYSGEAPVEGEGGKDGMYEFRVSSNKGESFVLYDGKWLDLAEESTARAIGIDFRPNNACIKALF